jgi:hypothetical protein
MKDEARPAALPFPDERKAARRMASVAATVRELGSTPMQAQLLDISEAGCRLADCPLERGAEIWLQLPGQEPVRATVIWAKGRQAGCSFYAPARPMAAHRTLAGRSPRKALFGPRARGSRDGSEQ